MRCVSSMGFASLFNLLSSFILSEFLIVPWIFLYWLIFKLAGSLSLSLVSNKEFMN